MSAQDLPAEFRLWRMGITEAEWVAAGRGFMVRDPLRAGDRLGQSHCSACGYQRHDSTFGLCPECLIDHLNDSLAVEST